MNLEPLDNPVWFALNTHQQDFALGNSLVKRFPEDVLGFGAIETPTTEAFNALAELLRTTQTTIAWFSSEKLEIPYLGEIPLDTQIRIQADLGKPIVLSNPDSPIAKTYREIARKLAAQVSIANYAAPKLEVVEEKV